MIFNNFGFNRQATTLTPVTPAGGLIINLDAGNGSSYGGSGRTWTDLSGFGNSVVWINTPSFVNANASSYFQGDGNLYASSSAVMNGLPLNSPSWSISVYTMNDRPYNEASRAVIGWGDGGTNANFMITDNNASSGGNIIEIRGAGQNSDRPAAYPCVTGAWLNAAWTYTIAGGGVKTGYRNGTRVATLGGSPNPSTGVKATGTPGKFGALWSPVGNQPMNGRIALIRMWNFNLTDAEILADFNTYKNRYGL